MSMISTWKMNSFRDLDLLETAIMPICLFVWFVYTACSVYLEHKTLVIYQNCVNTSISSLNPSDARQNY